jgi:hypothetical protein
MRVFSLLCLAAIGLSPLATAQTVADPAQENKKIVRLTIDSDLDDPTLIRPARLADGYETWLVPDDFPAHAFAGKPNVTGGVVFGRFLSFDLHIGADDKVTRCEPSPGSADYTDLLEQACRLIQDRGHFMHGIDSSGQPQPGKRAMTLRFVIVASGQDHGPSPAPYPAGYRNSPPVLNNRELLVLPSGTLVPPRDSASIWVDIDERGRVKRCRIARQGTGSDTGDALLCRKMETARFEPAVGPDGKKVAARSHFVTFTEQGKMEPMRMEAGE